MKSDDNEMRNPGGTCDVAVGEGVGGELLEAAVAVVDALVEGAASRLPRTQGRLRVGAERGDQEEERHKDE